MNRTARRLTLIFVAIAVGVAALFASDKPSPTDALGWTTQAEARIGRPLTPMSYAGVARRTTRRAVAVGVARPVVVAPRPVVVAPRPVVVTPVRRCVQVVDAYGRILTRCY